MNNAWVVRPYPHGYYRMNEFLEKYVIGIGWPSLGELSNVKTRDEIKELLKKYYPYKSSQSLGQSAGIIYRFLNLIQVGDYVVVPDGDKVYVGKVSTDYYFDPDYASDDEGYPHQRKIEWLYDKKAIKRNLLTGRVFDSLKGRQTVFGTYFSDIQKIALEHPYFFIYKSNTDLKRDYIYRLNQGLLRNVNSETFEDAVCTLFSLFFPGLRRLSTTNSEEGDTDLLAELPGELNVRIQVKHFYPEQGEIEPWVVEQLYKSMEAGDHGIIITTGTISDKAKEVAETKEDCKISFIDGAEFAEHLFETIDSVPEKTLAVFGLTKEIGFL